MPSKVPSESAQWSRITPPSKFRPQTWKKLRDFSAWATLVVSVASLFAPIIYAPIMGAAFAMIGLVFYFLCDQNAPKPFFIRKNNEPAVHIGVDEYGLPLMLPVKSLVTHILLVATTGSGKTTLIRTMAESVMKLGGGFCFIDGKADTLDTYLVLYEIVKDVDREEDLLCLNFLNPNQSHTFNFLLYGDADFLAEVVSGFMQDSQGDNAYWQGKARILMKTILSCLVYKRDHKDKYPDFHICISEIRRYFSIHELIKMTDDPNLPLYDELGKPVKQRLMFYLNELGPWGELKGGKPSPAAQEVIRQHGFYVQQWGEPFDLLSGAFGKIFDTQEPDIDIVDVVVNSRILIVLLPSLSYSLGTLRGLGRAVLNTFKIALTTALGKDIVGDVKEIETKVRKNRPSIPFMLIADEYGSYAVEGMDTILAQARSLNMSVMISVQELASLFKVNESEAKRMLGNTVIKLCMKIEDTDTAEYITKRAGEEFYLMPGVSGSGGDLFNSISNWDNQYQYQKYHRLETRDFTNLQVGEGYIITGDNIRKYKSRYIPPKGNVKEMKLFRYVSAIYGEAQKRAREVIDKARKAIDSIMFGAYELFHEYGVGLEEEKKYKKYIKARNSYMQDMMEFTDVTINDLVLDGYLKVEHEEKIEIESIVLKRRKLQELEREIYSRMRKDDAFFNEVLKPSADVNQFLMEVVYDLRKMQEKGEA